MNKLDGKVVWVTGASSGIGEALVLALAKKGAKIVLSARREEELQRVLREAGLTEKNALIATLDLANEQSLAPAYEAVMKKFGQIDVLINNGGISQRSYFVETDLAVARRLMDINFFGNVALAKLVLPQMIARKLGQIVVVTSVVGKYGTPLRTLYSASKHALHGFYDALRAELWKENISVLLVAPGYVKTNISFNAVLGDGTAQGRMDAGQANGLTPEACAKQIIAAIESGKREIYPGGLKEVAGVYLKRFLPGLFSRVVRKVNVR